MLQVGTPNPNVTVWVLNLNRPKYLFPQQIIPPTSIDSSSILQTLAQRQEQVLLTTSPSSSINTDDLYHYAISVKWYNDHHLSMIWLNRAQNQSTLVLCKPPQFNCTTGYVQNSESGAWIQFNHVTSLTSSLNINSLDTDWTGPIFNSIGDVVQLLPVKDGEYGNFLHVCHIDIATKQIIPLTQGRFEVTNILGWDEVNHIM